jgi:hypothetical protein
MALAPTDGDFLCRNFLDAVNETRMENAESIKLDDQEDVISSTIGGPKKVRKTRPQTMLALQCANINAPEAFTSRMFDHLTWTYGVSWGINHISKKPACFSILVDELEDRLQNRNH